MSNAKEIELKHGTKAKAARLLDVKPQTFQGLWDRKTPEAVRAVLEVIREEEKAEKEVDVMLEEIKSKIQTA